MTTTYPERAGAVFRPTWILTATIVASAMAFIDGTVVNVALPAMQSDLHATVAGVQWVVEAYSLFLSALLLAGGALGDKLGRTAVFAAGTALFTAASVVCGVAPSLIVLVGARAVQGIGAALLVPGSLSIISALFPADLRGRAIGTWAGFASMTTALGPVAGGWLVEHVSWRAVFFLNLPLGIIVIVVALRFIPETRSETAGPIDWPGAALATLGLGGLTVGLVQASGGTPPLLVAAAILLGVLALAGFVAIERRSLNPLVPLHVFRSPTFLGANVLTLLLYGALGGALFFLPFDLIRVQGYTATEAGFALLPFPVLMFVLSRWTGGIAGRVGARVPMAIGSALAGAGFALFAVPTIGGSYWTTFFPGVLVLGLGMSIAVAPLTTAVMGAVPSEHSGVASGINNAASRVSGLLAIAAFGIVVVAVFSRELQGRLVGLSLPAPARTALNAGANKLVADPVPGGLQPALGAAVRHAISASFVSGFRVLMVVAAALAIFGSVVTLVSVRDTPTGG